MPPGRGRRAKGKVDRKLEDDELFKQIGGQLDSTNFDYSQWQRTGEKKGPPLKVPERKPMGLAARRDSTERPASGTSWPK